MFRMTRLRVTPDETHILSLTRLRVTPDETHILSLGTSKGGCVSPHLNIPLCVGFSSSSRLFNRKPTAFRHSHRSNSYLRVFLEHTTKRASIPLNHNLVRVPRAYDDQSILAQTIISFVFPEHTMTRASMPKP